MMVRCSRFGRCRGGVSAILPVEDNQRGNEKERGRTNHVVARGDDSPRTSVHPSLMHETDIHQLALTLSCDLALSCLEAVQTRCDVHPPSDNRIRPSPDVLANAPSYVVAFIPSGARILSSTYVSNGMP
jgi:hypothetical protein